MLVPPCNRPMMHSSRAACVPIVAAALRLAGGETAVLCHFSTDVTEPTARCRVLMAALPQCTAAAPQGSPALRPAMCVRYDFQCIIQVMHRYRCTPACPHDESLQGPYERKCAQRPTSQHLGCAHDCRVMEGSGLIIYHGCRGFACQAIAASTTGILLVQALPGMTTAGTDRKGVPGKGDCFALLCNSVHTARNVTLVLRFV